MTGDAGATTREVSAVRVHELAHALRVAVRAFRDGTVPGADVRALLDELREQIGTQTSGQMLGQRLASVATIPQLLVEAARDLVMRFESTSIEQRLYLQGLISPVTQDQCGALNDFASELMGYLDGAEVGPEGRNAVIWARMVESLVELVCQMAGRQARVHSVEDSGAEV